MCDDDRPPLPPTCRTSEPWVNPWGTEPVGRGGGKRDTDQPLVDWGSSQPVSYGGGTAAGVAMALSMTVLAVLLVALFALVATRCV